MTLDKKLYTLKYSPDTESHLNPNQEQCKLCENRNCTYICPAGVYEWNEEKNELIINFENCLECGACSYISPARRPLAMEVKMAKDVDASHRTGGRI